MLETLQVYLATGIGSVIKALLLLLLAWIAAKIAKALVLKILKAPKIAGLLQRADDEAAPGTTANYIAKLVYLLVFLLFVPGILGALNADSIAAPILNLLNTVWGYVPNILAAVIVLAVGVFVARLVRQLLIPVFQKIKVDRLQEKAGIEVEDSARLSNTLAYIVYVLILIPVIIVALEVLNIRAISVPAVDMLSKIFNVIPNIIVACLLIGIGTVIGKFAGQIVTRLIASTGADAKLMELTGEKAGRFVLSTVVGVVVQAVIVIFFLVEGVSVLGLSVLTGIGSAVIGYLPNIIAAVVVLAAAVFASRITEKAMKKTSFGAYILPVRIGIFGIAVFMILNQLGIASHIVNSAFILIMAALAVAFAIAFGIGGREFAANTLRALSEKTAKLSADAEPAASEDTDADDEAPNL